MTRRTPAEALADATAGLVAGGAPDLAGHLAYLLADLVAVVGGGCGAGLLVRDGERNLELLVSTSHRAEQVELFQLQHRAGPCLDAISGGREVYADTADEIRRRWTDVGEAIAEDFRTVQAAPLHWCGRSLGALNLLHPSPHGLDAATRRTVQTFADVASLTLVTASVGDHLDLAGAVRTALADRVVIEQAKGVLAYQLGVEMEVAYDTLLATARGEAIPLVAAAARAVQEARRSVVL